MTNLKIGQRVKIIEVTLKEVADKFGVEEIRIKDE